MVPIATAPPSRRSGAERLVRPMGAAVDALLGSRGCLFTFHRAAPPELWERLPNRNFYLDLDFLDELLGYLARTGWSVVTIEEALRRTARGRAGDRFVNFSVDDCYRDTFEAVIPLFRRHGVPVTLFVTTGIPDGTLPMCWAGLEDVLLNNDRVTADGETIAVPTAEAKRAAYDRIAADWDRDVPAQRYATFCAENGVDAEAMHWKHAMSWEMLDAVRDDPLVEIGGHTMSHARISSLSAAQAFDEIDGCRRRLRERLGVACHHFAFPYGRSGDCGPRDFDLVREAGFASGATTRKGLVRRGQDAYRLPRVTLGGSQRHLALAELHLTGMTGVAARVLGRV
ncbi:polysaccharide deacetylase family protein [Rhodoplanes sp. TEM]|uniref:Chitooligosaccharide deacetylase n=1 Tax=Rhodoplanes tepidamans TaxID=200616 RepID=A0ABT5JBT1_RHOTP|nr:MULTISPECIES: polysaccharide deacetylase family protein [Rhodoplanes]MDC7787141.1 polysaccharide deacetylase family protein [Rhodoplanes tepidamans]MDC7984295.1 polysaccharide deacetylase family protein [Rhodoplanes sp. TEM]MDQ0356092.1 peptidoglycan/xylan/chitin deacetylase (PgdA/CDA1 family) [Rhodoplanes tepidamans]